MKRRRTQITVWPAVADLMTVALIAVLLAGLSGGGGCDLSCESALRDRIKDLETENNRLRAGIKEEPKPGSPSCFARDGDRRLTALVIITIEANETYRIQRNPNASLRELGSLSRLITNTVGRGLTAQEFGEFAQSIHDWGRSRRCSFWVQVRQGNISREECALRWLQHVGPHFGGATNPGSLCKSGN